MVAEGSGSSNLKYHKLGFPKPESLKPSHHQELFALAVGWLALMATSKHPANFLSPLASPAMAWGAAESCSKMYARSVSCAVQLQSCRHCPAVNCSAAALLPPAHTELIQSRWVSSSPTPFPCSFLPQEVGSGGFLSYSLAVGAGLLQTVFRAGLILLLPNLVHTHTARVDPSRASLNPSRRDKGALCAFKQPHADK